jgi:Pyridoxamine 5'-phosphate oxidase
MLNLTVRRQMRSATDVHETGDDLRTLQAILDRSSARAGAHLRSVFRNKRPMSSADVAATLRGAFVLHLATVSGSNRPVVAPIDGLLLHGRLLFSVVDDSVRARHLRRWPYVSATYTEGNRVCVIAHGRAVQVDATVGEVRALFEEVYGAATLAAYSKPGFSAFIEPSFMVAYRD